MNRKRWIALGLVILLMVVYMRTPVDKGVSTTEGIPFLSSESYSTATYKKGGGDNIALLRVNGVIIDQGQSFSTDTAAYNHQSFLRQVEEAFKRSDIKAIVMAIDSPGGGLYESDQAYQKLMQMKEQYNKPLVVSMGSMAASGGYYIAMPADQIFAERTSLTGSIGVIMTSYNYQELAEKIGIREEVFKSGENKDLLNPMREATAEERKIMQGIIDESYGLFVDVVAEGRNMDPQTVIGLADGTIYTANQAVGAGLIDRIGDLDAAIKAAGDMIQESDPNVIFFKNPPGYYMNWLLSKLAPQFDLLGLQENIQNNSIPRAMFLYRP